MIVDVHCHLAGSARRVSPNIDRASFEPDGSRGLPGFDAYLSPAMLKRPAWRYLRWRLGIDVRGGVGEALDEQMEAVWRRHLLETPGLDRIVVLAFDEYHTDEGEPVGPVTTRQPRGSSFYVSNSLAADYCAQHPEKLLLGASIHPYRNEALTALKEVRARGAVLIKWLPVVQNINAADPRTIAFVRRAGELGMPLLIHYGGEMTLRRQHPNQEDPGPMLTLLSELHQSAAMPPTIVAHAATPALPWQRGLHVATLLDAMSGPLCDAPLYADISAVYYRPKWLRRFAGDARYTALRKQLVFGSDFPVPPTTMRLRSYVRKRLSQCAASASWIERSLQIMRAVGFDESVFHRGAEALRLR